jgi:hypothetical protein
MQKKGMEGLQEEKGLQMKVKGNMGAITLVLTGVTIIIGVIVFYQISTAIPAPPAGAALNAINNVTSTFYNAIQLLIVGMIVLAAAVVLGYVFLIRG